MPPSEKKQPYVIIILFAIFLLKNQENCPIEIILHFFFLLDCCSFFLVHGLIDLVKFINNA